MRGPRHKRYLLLTSDRSIDDDAKRELTRRIAKISPVMARKAVWFERALIVKTDNIDIPLVRGSLVMSAGNVRLRPMLTSGSIGKLKKAVPR